jgi:hypothetical protein
MNPENLQGCSPSNPVSPDYNIDKAPPYCKGDGCPPETPNQNKINTILGDGNKTKKGLGQAVFCDPTSTGQITPDPNSLDKSTIYRNSRAIRGVDEAVMDLFKKIVVEDEMGVFHQVPIKYGSQEKAVDFIIQDNIRKDNSLVVDRIKLPLMSIYNAGVSPNMNRYTYSGARNYFRTQANNMKPGLMVNEGKPNSTILSVSRGIPIDVSYTLTVWTLFIEDMNQILEQIILKFDQLAYIRVQGVQWESVVRVDSFASNLDTEPGQDRRVVKYQINLTAETYIPQPIHRDKSVLKTRIEIVDGVDENQIAEIISRIECEANK